MLLHLPYRKQPCHEPAHRRSRTSYQVPFWKFCVYERPTEHCPGNNRCWCKLLKISYTAAATALPGGFIGYVFIFVGAPAITNLSVDSTSTYSPALSFNASTIFVNEAEVQLTPASHVCSTFLRYLNMAPMDCYSAASA